MTPLPDRSSGSGTDVFVGADLRLDECDTRGYYSLRSPYSWLVHRRLAEAGRRARRCVHWVPFFESATAGRPEPRSIRCASLTLAGTPDTAGRWDVPHLAVLEAPEDLRPRFVDAVFRLRWVEGADVTHPVVLQRLADRLGFSLDRGWLFAETESAADTVRRMRRQALADGVFAVPYLHRGGPPHLWGADAVVEAVREAG